MKDLQTAFTRIDELRELNLKSPLFNHLITVADGIGALAWFFEEKPAQYVEGMIESIQYYGNKVLKEYRGK